MRIDLRAWIPRCEDHKEDNHRNTSVPGMQLSESNHPRIRSLEVRGRLSEVREECDVHYRQASEDPAPKMIRCIMAEDPEKDFYHS